MKQCQKFFARASLWLMLILVSSSSSADDLVVTLDIDRPPVFGSLPVRQSFILTEVADASGILMLFPGGGGKLGVANFSLDINSNNFLVRSRHLLAAEGFHTATMDAATDFLAKPGGLRNNRRTEAYMTDVATVLDYLRNKYPDLPVWLVGTSRGSIAAANAAVALPPSPLGPDGLVLTASVTRPSANNNDSLERVAVNLITIPTLIVHHEEDACVVTPPNDVDSLKDAIKTSAPKVSLKMFDGGLPSLTNECGPLSPHGFFGIERKVTKKIAKWIRKSLKDQDSPDD